MSLPLPDLCKPPRLALVLAMAELCVVLVFLAPSSTSFSFQAFCFASFAALWVAIAVAVCVSLLASPLRRWTPMGASLLAIVISAVIGGVAMAALYALDEGMGTSLVPRGVSWIRFVASGGLISALLLTLVLRYVHVVENWKAQVEAAGQAQVQALQARIKPHFLFNSMNVIAALVRFNPSKAEEAILDLSDLFRAALGAGDRPSSLQEEIGFAQQYLAIEQLRMGEKMTQEWVVQQPLPDIALPRLLLQPLVENAVLHGVSRLPGGGCIRVEIACADKTLVIRVENPTAATEALLDNLVHAGHALGSTRARLLHMYPQASFVAGNLGETYQATMKIPL